MSWLLSSTPPECAVLSGRAQVVRARVDGGECAGGFQSQRQRLVLLLRVAAKLVVKWIVSLQVRPCVSSPVFVSPCLLPPAAASTAISLFLAFSSSQAARDRCPARARAPPRCGLGAGRP